MHWSPGKDGGVGRTHVASGLGACRPPPASSVPRGPISFSPREHLCSFCQQGPRGWWGCPAGLVGVPHPWRVDPGTVTAAPLPPHGWNAGEGHRKAVTLSQKWADKKGDRLKPSHPALVFSSVRQKPSSHWSLLGPLPPLTTSARLLLPTLVPRPQRLLPSLFIQVPPGTRGLQFSRQLVLPHLLQPLCVSFPHLE